MYYIHIVAMVWILVPWFAVYIDKTNIFIIPQNFRNYGEVDAYVIVYSLTDRDTFQRAKEILHEVSRHVGGQSAAIMVANKSELVRCRQVTEEGEFPDYKAKSSHVDINLNASVFDINSMA